MNVRLLEKPIEYRRLKYHSGITKDNEYVEVYAEDMLKIMLRVNANNYAKILYEKGHWHSPSLYLIFNCHIEEIVR